MAELREMPRIRVEPDKLMEWGGIRHGSEDMASAVEQRTFGFAEFGTNKAAPTATKVRGGYYTLPRLFDAVFVIAFDRLVFPDIQQEVLLLLGDGRNRNAQTYGRLYTRQVVDGSALLSMARTSGLVSHVPERHTHAHMKWTSLFLEDDEFRALSDAASGRSTAWANWRTWTSAS